MESDIPQQNREDIMKELAPQIRETYRQRDRSITGFQIPICISNDDEYDQKIEEELNRYVKFIKQERPALNREPGLVEKVTFVCDHIIAAIREERCGNTSTAQGHILNILKEFKEDSFFASDMDKSYAFRGSAPFKELWSPLYGAGYYEKQLHEPLSFYRSRVGKVDKREKMLHIPLTMRSKIGTNRFSLPGIPCLYLSTTSFCCWQELDCPEEMSISGFRLTEEGKKRKILNLVISEALINGVTSLLVGKPLPESAKSMIALLPLVMAISVNVIADEPNKQHLYKPNYTISHLIMRCLKTLEVDGVTYLSAKSASEFEYPYCVNLALPVFSSSATEKIGEICKTFEITDPICCVYNRQATAKSESKSYINTIYKPREQYSGHLTIRLAGADIPYSKTSFANIDNELMGKPFFPIISG